MPSRGGCIRSRSARTTSTATSTTRTSARRSAISARSIARRSHPKGYVLRARRAAQEDSRRRVDLGGDQILMQGGLHPKLTLEWYEELLRDIKSHFPQVNIHGFSPPEIYHFTKVTKLPLRTVLERLKAAGLGSLPGGGGEILVDRVPQGDHARQGADRRLAQCESRLARTGRPQHGDDDVRPRRNAGRADRTSGTAAATCRTRRAASRRSSAGRFSPSTPTWRTFRRPARSSI